MYASLFNLMGMMFLTIFAGAFLRRKGIITDEGKKVLTDIILLFILPCNIIKSYMMSIEEGFWLTFFILLLVASGVQALSLILAHTLYRGMKESERQVYQYGTVCSNAGFLGLPFTDGVFGTTGLLYATVFLVPQRIVMWTAGAAFFQKGGASWKAYKKILTNVCMIATYFGIIVMLFQLKFPPVIELTISKVAAANTALTMIYIGSVVGDVDFHGLITRNQVYFAIIRLFIIPLITYVICSLIGLKPLVVGVATLIAAMPCGSTTPLLAQKYGADVIAGAKAVIFTTVLSLVTLPLWSMFLLSRM
ncbi:MAG: AEC family transporter [Sphaerochaetaceae bacterium]|nr:AEC family transporter [Sphaerochaetaceae bacterium]